MVTIFKPLYSLVYFIWPRVLVLDRRHIEAQVGVVGLLL